MITRTIEKLIQDRLWKQKIIIIYGARQVGKTTLSQKILSECNKKTQYINCDLYNNQELLDYRQPHRWIEIMRDYDMVVFDEAQRIEQIGIILKILIDTFPEKQFIATGSSSFDLANKISEPLTGRNFTFTLFPLSVEEIRSSHDLLFLE